MNELLIAPSLMPCVVVVQKNMTRGGHFIPLLLNYCSLWPCLISACLIISGTVVDNLTLRAEFYDFIFYFIYPSIAKKI